MARSPKTPKFKAFNSYPNCFGPKQDEDRRWQEYLDDTKPLILEIGCGKAELSIELARKNPAKNYIGIDLKADRLYVAASYAIENEIDNIAFIQMHVQNALDYFALQSIDEIWLTFPDPYRKDRQAKHRMTGRNFLKLYHDLLKPRGVLNFKTDNKTLFEWSLDELKSQSKLFKLKFCTNDLHAEKDYDDAKIITTYESRYLSGGIKTNYFKALKIGS